MNKILQGDALTKLKELPEQSVNMCMTSPPYWALRDYGDTTSDIIWGGDENCKHKWGEKIKQKGQYGLNKDFNKRWSGSEGGQKKQEEMKIKEINQGNFCQKCGAWKGQLGLEPTFDQYISNLCDIFDEVKGVLRDDGTCWVNIGDTYYGNSSYSNSGRAGFKPKDDNTDEWKRQFGDGKCLACGKPCETQFCDRTCLNKMGNNFRSQNRQLPSKCLTMIPFRFALEMQNRGWILRNTIIWHKPNCMPSSVRDRFTVDFEYLFFFSKKKKYYFKQQLEPSIDPESYKGMRPRKAHSMSKHDLKNYAFAGSIDEDGNLKNVGKKYPNRNKRTTWRICPRAFKETHFAVYPEELCETPIAAGCPEGGVVLDPFFGAGTTGLVALKQNKKFIGIELNPEYIKIAEERLKPLLEQTTLSLRTIEGENG